MESYPQWGRKGRRKGRVYNKGKGVDEYARGRGKESGRRKMDKGIKGKKKE